MKSRLIETGLSQSELARRVGVAQPTIYNLIHRSKIGSKHIHRVARELGTTPAYLTGEVDDPHEDAPAPAVLDAESRELVDRFGSLTPADRRALLQVARSMAGPDAHPTVQAQGSEYRGEDKRT